MVSPSSQSYNDRPSSYPSDWSQHVARTRGALRPSFAPRGGFTPRFNSHTGPSPKADGRPRGGFNPCRGFYGSY